MKQPYIYTLPEQFITDKSVPMRWKLYALINGFWIGGKEVFASNEFFALKLGCSERHIQTCLEDLEKEKVLRRIGVSQQRRIVPWGTNSGVVGGRTGSSKGDEPRAHHTSVSNSDNSLVAGAPVLEIKEEPEDGPRKPKSKAKYADAKVAFSWLPNREASWDNNTTELECGLLLFKRGEDAVRKFVRYVQNHKDDEGFNWRFVIPSDYERKWPLIAEYAKRNS